MLELKTPPKSWALHCHSSIGILDEKLRCVGWFVIHDAVARGRSMTIISSSRTSTRSASTRRDIGGRYNKKGTDRSRRRNTRSYRGLNCLAVHRSTQTPVSTGLLPPPCWFPVCPASSAFLVCKPTEFPSFLSCRRLSHESELLGSDPSLTIILAKATEET